MILIVILRSFFRIYADLFRLPEFRGLLVVASLYIVVGGAIFRAIEKWEWIDAFYFGVVSLTTVGYGDVTPKTDPGKLFAMLYLLAGVGLLSGLIAIVGDGTRRTMAAEHERRMKAQEALRHRAHEKVGHHPKSGAEGAGAPAHPAEPPSASPPAQE
ncbi:MAG: potassium channel family protein [Anaerolineae bacterium]